MSKRLTDFRRKHDNPLQFIDINFEEITSRPIETAKKIYDHFGIEFKPVFVEKMKHFLQEEEKNNTMKSKADKVKLEDIQISEEDIEENFKDYIQQYIHKSCS